MLTFAFNNNILFLLSFLIKEKFIKTEHKIETFVYKLRGLNPNLAFDKGFALLEKDGYKVDIDNITEGDIVDLRFKNRKLKAKILKVE